MNARFTIPPMANEDRLPHEKAVWREVPIDGLEPTAAAGRQVAVEYADGSIVQDWADRLSWIGATRWRFGWAPRKDVAA